MALRNTQFQEMMSERRSQQEKQKHVETVKRMRQSRVLRHRHAHKERNKIPNIKAKLIHLSLGLPKTSTDNVLRKNYNYSHIKIQQKT